MALDIDKIDKAYLRFKAMYDNLVFRLNTSSDKTHEVRCNSRVVYSSKDKEACEDIVKQNNEHLEPLIMKEWQRLKDEIEDA